MSKSFTYQEAKSRLMRINRMEREAQKLSQKIESIQRWLQSSTDLVIIDTDGTRKDRTEVMAELLDLKDQLIALVKDVELKRLQLLQEIESLDDDNHKWFLKLRYVYGMTYREISYQEHYNIYWVQKKVIAATKYYADRLKI